MRPPLAQKRKVWAKPTLRVTNDVPDVGSGPMDEINEIGTYNPNLTS